MDRTEFLNRCQKCSTLPLGLCGVRQKVPIEWQVSFNGVNYYPRAYLLTFDKGKPMHSAIIHSLEANSEIQARLDLIEEAKTNGDV